jgi:hypothetical protein
MSDLRYGTPLLFLPNDIKHFCRNWSNGILQLHLLLRRQFIKGDIHDVVNVRHLESARVSHRACQKVCWRKITTMRQAHSKPNEASLKHVPDPKRASQFS